MDNGCIFLTTMGIKSYHIEIPPHPSQNIYHYRNKKKWYGGCKGVGPLYTLQVGVKTGTRENQCRVFSKSKVELPNDLAIVRLDVHRKRWKAIYNRDVNAPMFMGWLFIIAKSENQLSVYLQMNQWWKCDLCTQWRIIHPPRRMKSCYLQGRTSDRQVSLGKRSFKCFLTYVKSIPPQKK